MRRKSLGSRESVLLVAAEMFSEKGYRATTMQDIAQRLKVSKPTLYANIGDKEEILSEIIETWIVFTENSLRRALKSDGGPRDKLISLVHDWSENAVSRRAFQMVFLSDERELPADVIARYRRWQDKAFHRIRDCIRDGQSTGVFRADLNATVTAFSIIAFINSLPKWYDHGGDLTIKDIAAHYLDLLDLGTAPASKAAQVNPASSKRGKAAG